MAVTAILDIDGTLVDTNYHHALAWHRALHSRGHRVQMWKVHRHIGMGGDKIVAALAGEEAEREEGDAIRDAEGEAYGELIGEVEPMEGARELIEDLRENGSTVILASSAKQEEVEHYLDLLDARDLVDGWTSSADVEQTKPAEAAGVLTLAVLTGGFSEAELREAGCGRRGRIDCGPTPPPPPAGGAAY